MFLFEQPEAVTSESEGENEVAVPAGEEGSIWFFRFICQKKVLGEGEEGLDWEYEELPEGAGGDDN